MIIADVHEPEELRNIADEVKNLGFDYWIIGSEKEYIIERKTLVDLVGSIRGGKSKVKDRFFEQIIRVKDVVASRREDGKEVYGVIILEGNQFKRYNARFAKMSPTQFIGIQARIVESELGLLRTWTINETKLCLQILNKRAGEERRDIVSVGFKKEYRSIDEEAMHMMMAVKGIGVKSAQKLFNAFGSVINIVNASESELVRVVGDKVGKHLKEVVNKRVRKDESLQ